MFPHSSAIWFRVSVLLTILIGCNAQPPVPEQAEKPLVQPPEVPPLDPVHIGEERLRSPLLETLRQQIERTETEETREVTEPLTKQLVSADAIMSDARRRNRTAIQQANRQVRMGAARQSPNFIIITVDRLGIGDLGCYGQTNWETPALDKVAAEGLRFTQCYSELSPNASLSALFTGHFESTPNSSVSSSPSRMTSHLPRVLWNAGYKTALIGEWSEDLHPNNLGYEESSGWNVNPPEFPDWALLNGKRITLENNSSGQHQVSQNDFLISETRSFLREARGRVNQFYLHYSVHALDGNNALPTTPEEYSVRVRQVDSLVGRITEAVDELGIANRTCLLVLALAGPDPKSKELTGKTRSTGEFSHSTSGLNEGNLRVPFLVRWPEHIAPGTTSDEAVGPWDILPTLAQLASVSRPIGRVNGQSLAGLWQKMQPLMERPIVWMSPDGKVLAARDRNWKLISDGEKRHQLYDLSSDRTESRDVSTEHPEVLQRVIKTR